jgi:hypothetical protein
VLDYDAVGQLGLVGSSTNPAGFPRLASMNNAFGGSNNLGPSNANHRFNDKPTTVASVTWVRNNHTIKAGAEFRIDVFQDRNQNGDQGIYTMSPNETGEPSTNGQSLSGGVIGFPYASFMLGLVDSASVRPPYAVQYRKSTYSLFLQDTWKITSRITLDYGLRWDYFEDAHELYNRTSTFDPAIPNPSAGGLLGGLLYPGSGPGRCNCQLDHPYPFSIGPRLGLAYQIDPKTVFRGGWGIVYGGIAVTGYAGDANAYGVGLEPVLFANPSYGFPAVQLHSGLPYSPAQMYTATYSAGDIPAPGQAPPTPPSWWDPAGARSSRINQWSAGLQRQITPNLMVEAAFVGHRGVWETANSLNALNAIGPQRLSALGLNLSNSATRSLLTSTLASPTAQAAGYTAPYPGLPLTNTVAQSLRPFPQFGSVSARNSPLGKDWYDALQAKITRRLAHGFDLTFSFAYSQSLSNTGSLNDVFVRGIQKYLDVNSQPLVEATALHYEVPGFRRSHLTTAITSGWTLGAVSRWASGLPILTPASQGNLNSLVFQTTYTNRVPGQPLFTKSLNCNCINPFTDFVLNPHAWAEPASGQFGESAPYFNDYRNQRTPDEQINIGRTFKIGERVNLQVRAEFFNAFNRVRYMPFLTSANGVAPTSNNASATQVVNSQGIITSGFGQIVMGNRDMTEEPRTGQLIARITF